MVLFFLFSLSVQFILLFHACEFVAVTRRTSTGGICEWTRQTIPFCLLLWSECVICEGKKWERENPCKSCYELGLCFSWVWQRQRRVLEPNPQWEVILQEYAMLHHTCMHKVGSVTQLLYKCCKQDYHWLQVLGDWHQGSWHWKQGWPLDFSCSVCYIDTMSSSGSKQFSHTTDYVWTLCGCWIKQFHFLELGGRTQYSATGPAGCHQYGKPTLLFQKVKQAQSCES
jgi:hypothetical protein